MKVEINNFYNLDCLIGMRKIHSEAVDMILTDPPYLINYVSNFRKVKFKPIENDDNNYELIANYLIECERIMKQDTAIYMFCSWHNIEFFKAEFQKHFKLKNILVWKKNNHGAGDLKAAYAPKHEFILFGHKGRPLLRGKRGSDVLEFRKVPNTKMQHPTEKPLELLEYLIQNSSDPGDLIFDGFAGIGTTLIAAKKLNRSYLGFEIETDNFNLGKVKLLE